MPIELKKNVFIAGDVGLVCFGFALVAGIVGLIALASCFGWNVVALRWNNKLGMSLVETSLSLHLAKKKNVGPNVERHGLDIAVNNSACDELRAVEPSVHVV